MCWAGTSLSYILYGISQLVKIRDAKRLRQDVEDDPFIKDQMTYLG